MPYSVFTHKYDSVVCACDLLTKSLATKTDPDTDKILLTYLSDKAPKISIPLTAQKRPLTFILDCSGSLRGERITSVVSSLLALGDALAAQNYDFEILGFTTHTWKGGKTRTDWISQNRIPETPGRLNELKHIVFKAREAQWETSKVSLCYTLLEGVLKENIDGEALLWAKDRTPENGHIVFISDGAPVDDATLASNHRTFLEDHLNLVLDTFEAPSNTLSLTPVLLGYDVTERIRIKNAVLVKTVINPNEVVAGLLKSF
jgi:cobaltochelatase CobT